MTTNLWHIKRTDRVDYDECAAMVLAADNEPWARSLAADNASDEGSGPWLDGHRSSASLIGESVDSITSDTVLLRDVWEG